MYLTPKYYKFLSPDIDENSVIQLFKSRRLYETRLCFDTYDTVETVAQVVKYPELRLRPVQLDIHCTNYSMCNNIQIQYY